MGSGARICIGDKDGVGVERPDDEDSGAVGGRARVILLRSDEPLGGGDNAMGANVDDTRGGGEVALYRGAALACEFRAWLSTLLRVERCCVVES